MKDPIEQRVRVLERQIWALGEMIQALALSLPKASRLGLQQGLWFGLSVPIAALPAIEKGLFVALHSALQAKDGDALAAVKRDPRPIRARRTKRNR